MISICKKLVLLASLLFFCHQLQAQGCSDAGVCTIGNFNNPVDTLRKTRRQEIDFVYTSATHGKNERYYSPQLNYRNIAKNGSFFELRLPLNTIKDKSNGLSTSGIGDLMVTYNSKLSIKNLNLRYSVGFRVSFSDAAKGDHLTSATYPMYLQPGLGTTDFVVAINYDFCKYLSLGTGIQAPIFQYNKNEQNLYTSGIYNTVLQNFRRQPDALLKLTGHYAVGKFKINGGALAIFHLADDYYDHRLNSTANYKLDNSAGTTVNMDVEFGYAISKKLNFSLLYAEPLKTRANTPEGLARSRIVSPKLTVAF